MNRWWGNSADAERQAGERSSRAARRTISSLPVVQSDSEEDYLDCDTSGIFGDLDGNDDTAIDDMAAAAELARQRALPVDEANYDNDPESWKKELKLKFDAHWFNDIEADMKKYGINRQWDKKNAIKSVLPEDVIEELKPLLRLTEAEAGDTIYKDVKTELLSIYGPKQTDAFRKAMALRLTGRPSALGKQLIHLICPGSKPMDSCHCANMIFGFWEAQMTPQIRTKLAGQIFDKNAYKTIFKLADEVWEVNGGASAAVVAAAKLVTAPINAPSPAQDGDAAQISALQRGRGRGGNNRGAYNQNQNYNNQNPKSKLQ